MKISHLYFDIFECISSLHVYSPALCIYLNCICMLIYLYEMHQTFPIWPSAYGENTLHQMSNLCSDLHIIIKTNINIIPILEDGQLSTVFKVKAAQLFQMCLFEFSVVT